MLYEAENIKKSSYAYKYKNLQQKTVKDMVRKKEISLIIVILIWLKIM